MKIGLFFGSFKGGGAERMMVNLAKGLYNRGINVVIYVCKKEGPYLTEVPGYIKIHSYDAQYGVKSVIHKIRRTLKNDNLTSFISTQMHINAAVALASIGSSNRPKIIFREANTPSEVISSHVLMHVYKWLYKAADSYVAVSSGVKKDMEKYLGIKEKRIEVIYNPVVDDTILEKMNEDVDHNWFNDASCPVILGVGRFSPQKGFEDLIDAFSLVRMKMNVRLVIIGKTDQNIDYFKAIQKKVAKLGLEKDVLFPGFVSNPFKYLSSANVFVLSSKFEGLPGVLIQALACGCPVVSTDCPSGPSEILEDGKFGELVQIGDIKHMANAIVRVIEDPLPSNLLKHRANFFSISNSTKEYLKILE